jgi:ribosomal-protein-alanine N-acetyltransferase
MSLLLETPRLLVRSPVIEDIPALYPHYSDTETMTYLPFLRWQSLEDGHAWLQRMRSFDQSGSAHQWIFERKQDRQMLGAICLFNKDMQDMRAEIGYMQGQVHWGQGYAQEAARAVIDFAFDTLKLHRLEATVNPANAASFSLLLRLGFQYEGTQRERHQYQGEYYDMAWYSLLAREWRAFPEKSRHF